MQRELLSAAVYISSGAATVATQAARAAARAAPRACVVDTFADPAYARSSVKIVGPTDDLLEATLAAARDALESVDLRAEPAPAPHPRQGAVDMVSFMPLTERRDDDLLETCDALAWRFGAAFDGVPVLMYGPRKQRSLVEARRGTSFFASTKDAGPPFMNLAPDFGPSNVTAEKGAAVVGAQPCINQNFTARSSSTPSTRRLLDDVVMPVRHRRDRTRTAASSPRNDLVKNYLVHPTHCLISTQVVSARRCRPTRLPRFTGQGAPDGAGKRC